MLSNPGPVVITTEEHPFLTVHASTVHHREIPEVQGEGQSPEDAVARLVERLSRTLDNAERLATEIIKRASRKSGLMPRADADDGEAILSSRNPPSPGSSGPAGTGNSFPKRTGSARIVRKNTR